MYIAVLSSCSLQFGYRPHTVSLVNFLCCRGGSQAEKRKAKAQEGARDDREETPAIDLIIYYLIHFRDNNPAFERCAEGLVFDPRQKICAWSDEALRPGCLVSSVADPIDLCSDP